MRENNIKYILVAPALLAVLITAVFPVIKGLLNAFYFVSTKPHKRNGEFIGFENFYYIFGDAGFQEAMWITLVFTLLSVILTVGVALAMSLVLMPQGRLQYSIRSLLILPFAMSPALVGYIWRFMFNDDFGLFAEILDFIPGLHDAVWLNDRVLTFVVLVASDVWNWASFLCLILLGGLAAVPLESQEAARIDGANSWQVFRDVTLPSILPVLLICIVLKTIFSLKMFDQIYTLSQGAPGTQTLGYYIYYSAQKYNDAGGAAAMSVILIIPMAVMAYLYMRLIFRKT